LEARVGIEHHNPIRTDPHNFQQYKPLRSFLNVFNGLTRVLRPQELFWKHALLFLQRLQSITALLFYWSFHWRWFYSSFEERNKKQLITPLSKLIDLSAIQILMKGFSHRRPLPHFNIVNKAGIPMSDITLMLEAISAGDSQASEQLLPLVYNELRRLAAARMSQEAAGHTLQPTALVHEAWLRLAGGQKQSWENRAHFFGAAAEAMRRILIERARRKSRLKRGSGQALLDIAGFDVIAAMPDDKVLLVDEALDQLKLEDPEKAKIVLLKFFAGMTNEQAAEIMNVNERTVRRQWEFAKAWLFDRIRGEL
jgi:RNA polymerase sigma factor (TIGR02999 family)